MRIELTLEKIRRLLSSLSDPQSQFKAIHIAGTNGKGSVVSYVYSALLAAKINSGRFTSPHLKHRYDCISLNGREMSYKEGLQKEDILRKHMQNKNIDASPFEVLVALAFEEFRKVDVAIIEVGMGGRLDATNTLDQVLCTAVTKIGLDHTDFLGDTLTLIAGEKAGIMKKDVTCYYDSSNVKDVTDVLERVSKEVGAECLPSKVPKSMAKIYEKQESRLPAHLLDNLRLSLSILNYLKSFLPLTDDDIKEGIERAIWPGRMQQINFSSICKKYRGEIKVLIDGAHNVNAAKALKQSLPNKKTIWLVAFSAGKNYTEILKELLSCHDILYSTEFGAVDGMPWVSPIAADEIANTAKELGTHASAFKNYAEALHCINDRLHDEEDFQIVICGSLYLIGEIHRRSEVT